MPSAAALRFADLFATNHLAIDDAVYDDLRGHFTEDQIVALGLHCAMCVGLGRLAATWHVVEELPEEFREDSASRSRRGARVPLSRRANRSIRSDVLCRQRLRRGRFRTRGLTTFGDLRIVDLPAISTESPPGLQAPTAPRQQHEVVKQERPRLARTKVSHEEDHRFRAHRHRPRGRGTVTGHRRRTPNRRPSPSVSSRRRDSTSSSTASAARR